MVRRHVCTTNSMTLQANASMVDAQWRLESKTCCLKRSRELSPAAINKGPVNPYRTFDITFFILDNVLLAHFYNSALVNDGCTIEQDSKDK